MHAPRSQGIKMGRPHDRVARASKNTRAMLIGHDDHEVGAATHLTPWRAPPLARRLGHAVGETGRPSSAERYNASAIAPKPTTPNPICLTIPAPSARAVPYARSTPT